MFKVTVVNLARGNFTLDNPFGTLKAGQEKVETLAPKKFSEIFPRLTKLAKSGFISLDYVDLDMPVVVESKVDPVVTKGREVRGEPVFGHMLPFVAEPVVEAKVEPVVEAKVEPVVDVKVEPVVEAKVEPVVEAKVEPVVEAKVEPVVEAKVEPVVEADGEVTSGRKRRKP
jgi:hypothetical protein